MEGLLDGPRATQLRLFEPPKPLLERLGRAFFRSLPPRPGIYLMLDRDGRILYVGQSKNLRSRLASYLHVRPERDSRKLVRLVHRVDAIRWEECPTAEAARLRENELLRAHRPRFNSANTYPQAYLFLCLEASPGRVQLSLRREPGRGGQTYGAFKGGAGAGYAALLRLIWVAVFQPVSLDGFPCRLLGSRPPRQWALDLGSVSARPGLRALPAQLRCYLGGWSAELTEVLREAARPERASSSFQRLLLETDLQTLEDFFLRGPQRNRRWRQQLSWPGDYIPQEMLDDLGASHFPGLGVRPVGSGPSGLANRSPL